MEKGTSYIKKKQWLLITLLIFVDSNLTAERLLGLERTWSPATWTRAAHRVVGGSGAATTAAATAEEIPPVVKGAEAVRGEASSAADGVSNAVEVAGAFVEVGEAVADWVTATVEEVIAANVIAVAGILVVADEGAWASAAYDIVLNFCRVAMNVKHFLIGAIVQVGDAVAVEVIGAVEKVAATVIAVAVELAAAEAVGASAA